MRFGYDDANSADNNMNTMNSVQSTQFDDYRADLDVESVSVALATGGMATFDCGPDREALMSIVGSLGRIHPHRDSNSQGLTILEPNAGSSPGQYGFTREGLFPHTDSSGELRPPDIVAFYCEKRADFGGESLFVDGRELLKELQQNEDGLLPILARPDAAMFWSESGYIPMPIIAQDRWGRFAFRFRLDGLSHFSDDLAYRLPELIKLVHRHTLTIPFRDGQGFILNNGRWLHGRSSFRGYRRVLRILVVVDPASQVSLLRGFVS
jgi:hypothetical protein